MCGGSHAGEATIGAGKNRPDFFGTKFAEPDLDERPHDATAHFVEKAVPFYQDRDERALAPNVAAGEGPHGGFLAISRVGRERLKIVTADEPGSGPTDSV